MSFWSGEKIRENSHIVSDFSESQIDCNAYNLRMGNSFYRTANIEGSEQTKTIISDGETFIIPAGQFAYLLTKEFVNVPRNAIAFISMRTTLKWYGLINVSGFHVDPGYKGRLIFAVFNAGSAPVHLSAGDPIFKIWFCSLDRESDSVFKTTGVNDISNALVQYMNAPIPSLQSLRRLLDEHKESLQKHEAKIIEKVAKAEAIGDNLNVIYRSVITGLSIAAFLALFRLIFMGGDYVVEHLWPSSPQGESVSPSGKVQVGPSSSPGLPPPKSPGLPQNSN